MFDPRIALFDAQMASEQVKSKAPASCKGHAGVGGASRLLAATPGVSPRKQLNWFAIATALVVPVAFFALSICLMSYKVFYQSPGMAFSLLGIALLVVLVIGVGALQALRTQQKGGERSWWAFVFVTSLAALVLGSLLGYMNYMVNTKKFYNYISLRKVVDVDPGQWQGQQVLDAGEIDFKSGTRIDRSLNMMYHKSKTWCVAPIVPGDSSALASYDFWAVGTDCCSSRQGDFSCGPGLYTAMTTGFGAPAGLRVMDDAEIAGYKLAVEQAAAAYNIQTGRAIFLQMMKTPYVQIRSYRRSGNIFTTLMCALAVLFQGGLVAWMANKFGKGTKSGYMDLEKTRKEFSI